MALSGEILGGRGDILAALRAASDPLTVREISDQLDLHPNTVRFHMRTLVKTGLVETAVEAGARGPGRPPRLFRAVPQEERPATNQFRFLAEMLVEALAGTSEPVEQAERAGREWGRRHAEAARVSDAEFSTDRLNEMLTEIGFEPEPAGPDRIALRHCPFLELAEVDTEIVCAVHKGMMRGALDGWHSPVTVQWLEPLISRDLCLAKLEPVQSPNAG